MQFFQKLLKQYKPKICATYYNSKGKIVGYDYTLLSNLKTLVEKIFKLYIKKIKKLGQVIKKPSKEV